jgi:hypothetical protein
MPNVSLLGWANLGVTLTMVPGRDSGVHMYGEPSEMSWCV